ncbi:hypothetical protein J6590_076664 [Homalodisca vitripennis]|nr:hypothetical protein J6590_076664 [Homalodisca vitripennis]
MHALTADHARTNTDRSAVHYAAMGCCLGHAYDNCADLAPPLVTSRTRGANSDAPPQWKRYKPESTPGYVTVSNTAQDGIAAAAGTCESSGPGHSGCDVTHIVATSPLHFSHSSSSNYPLRPNLLDRQAQNIPRIVTTDGITAVPRKKACLFR